MIHLHTVNKLEKDKIERVRGLVAFVKGADSVFYVALQRKYGEGTIEGLLRRE